MMRWEVEECDNGGAALGASTSMASPLGLAVDPEATNFEPSVTLLSGRILFTTSGLGTLQSERQFLVVGFDKGV